MEPLVLAGIIGISFFTTARYYSFRWRYGKNKGFPSIFGLPKSRDDALIFAGQVAGILEILTFVLYEFFEVDRYLQHYWVRIFVLDILCFTPLVIGVLLAALMVKILNLKN